MYAELGRIGTFTFDGMPWGKGAEYNGLSINWDSSVKLSGGRTVTDMRLSPKGLMAKVYDGAGKYDYCFKSWDKIAGTGDWEIIV